MYSLTKLAKHKLVLGMIAAVLFGLVLAPTNVGASASSSDKDTFGLNEVDSGLDGTLGNKDLRETIGDLIQVGLSLLGVVAVVIILAGGFKWMTAGGNEEKVTEARKLIFSGIIGLAVILSAWAISIFVITQLSEATGSGDVPDFQ